MTENSVLVVAFDGLDKELIDEFDLDHVKQEEFGSVDNKTGISSIKTSELFASFITGKTHKEHSIKGLNKERGIKEFVTDLLFPSWALNNLRGFTRLKETVKTAINYENQRPTAEDIESETLFEKIDNSKALFVPSYNPTTFWNEHGTGFELRSLLSENRDPGYIWDLHEHSGRREKLFREVNKWYDFSMVHFHRPDAHQHFYGDKTIDSGHDFYDENKLETLYQETDELAKRIIEFFGKDYDYIIFMSDHGLPTDGGHNENAFYSCNRELFGDEVPRITDFYDKILSLVEG